MEQTYAKGTDVDERTEVLSVMNPMQWVFCDNERPVLYSGRPDLLVESLLL